MFKPSSTLAPVVFDADPTTYHKIGEQFSRGDARRTMSQSQLWEFAQCPRRWLRGIPKEDTEPMAHGSLVDCLFLTPQKFERDYAVAPEKYESEGMECQTEGCVAKGSVTDAKTCGKCRQPRVKVTIEKEWDWNATYCSEWRDEQKKAGKVVVKNDAAIKGHTANAALNEDSEIAMIRESCKAQVQFNVEWHCSETGLVIPFKALIDLLSDPEREYGSTIWDLKTTNDARMKEWQRRVYLDGLHFQAGAYMLAVNSVVEKKYKQFGHIISESKAPFEPTFRHLTVEFLQLGENDFTSAMRLYCQCLAKGKFPGFDRDMVDMAAWMIM